MFVVVDVHSYHAEVGCTDPRRGRNLPFVTCFARASTKKEKLRASRRVHDTFLLLLGAGIQCELGRTWSFAVVMLDRPRRPLDRHAGSCSVQRAFQVYPNGSPGSD